jgi:hypothetical protein
MNSKSESEGNGGVEMLNSITLFEIPIYSTSEEKFHKKWDNHINNTCRRFNIDPFNHENKEIVYMNRNIYRQQIVWKYRQIVAWIVVDVVGNAIGFSVYGELFYKKHGESEYKRKGFRYDRKNIANMPILVDHQPHFPYKLLTTLSNDELRENIKLHVKEKIDFYAKKPLYADTSLFDATIDSIDVLKLIEIRKKQLMEEQST